MTEPFFGNFDLAQLALYAFWLFFAGLVFYLQRENMREGYPLEDETGRLVNQGPFPLPEPKTFKLPHGRGEITVPNGQSDGRAFAMVATAPSSGSPFEPTGDPMRDGVGPAAWAERRDVPELDGHGLNKLAPMRVCDGYVHSAGRDPRGLAVLAADGAKVGEICDMWIDKPESLVRYLEIELDDGGKRLLPMPLARVTGAGVRVHSIMGRHFAHVPTTASETEVTLLEEEKICAYYAGGKLYAAQDRLDPLC